MTSTEPSYSGQDAMADIAFVLVMAAGTWATAWMLADSWPAGSWYFNCGLAVVVTLCVLARHHFPAEATFAALAACATGAGIAYFAELPQEPGPITSLAVGVLLGSVTRRAPTVVSLAAGLGAVGVLAATFASAAADGTGFTFVTIWFAVLATWGMVTGLAQRRSDQRSSRDRDGVAGSRQLS